LDSAVDDCGSGDRSGGGFDGDSRRSGCRGWNEHIAFNRVSFVYRSRTASEMPLGRTIHDWNWQAVATSPIFAVMKMAHLSDVHP
jgi:hypothetical protein